MGSWGHNILIVGRHILVLWMIVAGGQAVDLDL